MIRRKFLQLLTVSGVGSMALGACGSELAQTVVYNVSGFTCITCAVGLDTLLSKQKGILGSHSTYPQGQVTVKFDAHAIDEKSIESFIAEMGFKVQSRSTPA